MENLKTKIIFIILAIGAILIFIFQHGIYGQPSSQQTLKSSSPQTETSPKKEDPQEVKILSTNPDLSKEPTILPTQSLEITFNLPLENAGEFKNKLEPKTEYQIKLSDDRKTAIITPTKAFLLGTSYTLFIQTDSKFTGGKKLNQEVVYHFKTIDYNGI